MPVQRKSGCRSTVEAHTCFRQYSRTSIQLTERKRAAESINVRLYPCQVEYQRRRCCSAVSHQEDAPLSSSTFAFPPPNVRLFATDTPPFQQMTVWAALICWLKAMAITAKCR
mmetsp:Transcript_14634/g.40499  ORF Transcript_14634/g.40499 Transcript_14634/m.40499 type:complete len:113 (+) Transcript_14634:176-514(+)